MRCVNLRRIPNKAAKGVEDAYINVSCGKCYACLSNRRRTWLFRLATEAEHSYMTLFGTFTIDDSNCDGYVHKEDLQKFHKRLRHYFDFTFYAIGEYGTTTHRPHYHAVYFIKTPVDKWNAIETLQFNWHLGLSQVSRASIKRLNYVLHYHTRPKLVNNKMTFQLYSKGLGVDFINHDFVNWYQKTNKNIIHDKEGNLFVIPRYYRKKLRAMMIQTHTGIESFTDPDTGEIYSGFDFNDVVNRVFGKKLYQMSDSEFAAYLHERIQLDKNKLNKYHFQDKFN